MTRAITIVILWTSVVQLMALGVLGARVIEGHVLYFPDIVIRLRAWRYLHPLRFFLRTQPIKMLYSHHPHRLFLPPRTNTIRSSTFPAISHHVLLLSGCVTIRTSSKNG
ncbi:hypothetical protein RJT34_20215 [Clitoria ternatea]|uniref:Uncharacterized protein n=1 Tax=Clitoria ternatea TaxID=43366 RepID=A0AAN9ISJ4_CLITE